MSRGISYRSSAIRDIADIADHVGKVDPAVGLRFFEEVDELTDHLLRHRESCAIRQDVGGRYAGVRSTTIKGFRNYILFYCDCGEDGIAVVRVIHGARDLPAVLNEDV